MELIFDTIESGKYTRAIGVFDKDYNPKFLEEVGIMHRNLLKDGEVLCEDPIEVTRNNLVEASRSFLSKILKLEYNNEDGMRRFLREICLEVRDEIIEIYRTENGIHANLRRYFRISYSFIGSNTISHLKHFIKKDKLRKLAEEGDLIHD